MDFSNIFRLVNLVVGAVMVMGGISQFFPPTISSVIVAVYVILFGLATAGLELIPTVPSYLSRHASFLFSFLGRGIFYIFVGSIILEGGVTRIIAGSVVGAVGVAYVALEFVPSIEPPPNMRDADNAWGAEQV